MNTASDSRQIHLPSALFPFTPAQVFDHEYSGYRLLNVFGIITTAQRKQCVSMWLQAGVIATEEQAWQRSEQVCYMFFHIASGQLAGVNTLYTQIDEKTDEKWLLNRMFIRPVFRQSRLMVIGTSLMLVFSKLHLAKDGIKGVANINENQKLHRKGIHKIFSRLGYQLSHTSDNKEVWLFIFDHIEFMEN